MIIAYAAINASQMWPQLGMTARLETVSRHSIHGGAAFEILLILTPYHGLGSETDSIKRPVISSEVHSPTGVPFATLDRVDFTMKASGYDAKDLISCDEESEILDDYLCSANIHAQISGAIKSPSQSSGNSNHPCSQHGSAVLSQKSLLSSQTSISPLTTSSEEPRHSSRQPDFSRVKIDITDFVKLMDALIRRTLFGYKVVQSGIVGDNEMDDLSLSDLSPSIFCPTYHEVSNYKYSNEVAEEC